MFWVFFEVSVLRVRIVCWTFTNKNLLVTRHCWICVCWNINEKVPVCPRGRYNREERISMSATSTGREILTAVVHTKHCFILEMALGKPRKGGMCGAEYLSLNEWMNEWMNKQTNEWMGFRVEEVLRVKIRHREIQVLGALKIYHLGGSSFF